MKLAAITAATLLASATTIQAMDIGSTGISVGAKTVAEYNVDAENMTLEVTPSMTYSLYGTDVKLSSDLMVYNDDFVFMDVNPILDFKVGYDVWDHAEVYVETGYDLELEDRIDVVVGMSFSFYYRYLSGLVDRIIDPCRAMVSSAFL
jgi:opacity protein-like surface antigen